MTLSTQLSINKLKQRNLVLVVKDTSEAPRGYLYLDGVQVVEFEIEGTSFTKRVTIEGFDYLLEVEMEDVDIGIYTAFLYVILKDREDGTSKISDHHFINIEDVSDVNHPYNPDKTSQNWDVMVEVRANVHVTVVSAYKPFMNRAQAEAQGKQMAKGLQSGQFVVEAVTDASTTPVDKDGREIDL